MQATMMEFLRILLLNPRTHLEFVASSVLAVLVFALVLSKVGSAMGLKASDAGSSLGVLAITLAAVLGAAGLASEQWQVSGLALFGVGALAVLAIAVPSVCLIQKGGYFPALLALVISLVAAMTLVTFVHAGLGAFRGGETSVGRGLQHNLETEQFVK